jgi:hypothetical protein
MRHKNHKPSKWLHLRPRFDVCARGTTLLCHVAIYIPVLRVEIFPPLVAIMIQLTPIRQVVNDGTRSHTVGVNCHALYTDKRYPFDGPLVEMKTHTKYFLISEIFLLTKYGQYPSHIFHNLGPVVFMGFLQSQCLFNNGCQLFFNQFCGSVRKPAISSLVVILD